MSLNVIKEHFHWNADQKKTQDLQKSVDYIQWRSRLATAFIKYFIRHNDMSIKYFEDMGPFEVASIMISAREIKCMYAGGRLNKKDGLTRCGDSHVKDKTS